MSQLRAQLRGASAAASGDHPPPSEADGPPPIHAAPSPALPPPPASPPAAAAQTLDPCAAASRNASAGESPPPLLLYVGVLTRPEARERRDALRATWFRHSSPASGAWAGRFFLGRPKGDAALTAAVEAEAAAACDIEFVRGEDDYYSIAHKSLAILERGSLQERAAFVLKTDDDSFVYMQHLLPMLARCAARGGLYILV